MQNNFYAKYGKRAFDIVSSSIGLFLLSPVFFIIIVIIYLKEGTPIFYRHTRIGKNFKPFRLIKFRTMVVDADKKGLPITSGNDPRITGIGRILRKSKLDELPQLINVLKGEMSIVGPRPEVEKYVKLFKDSYKEILKVRPGITDIASIIYRDEEAVLKSKENPEKYYKETLLPQKIELAKAYVNRQSFLFDLKLIFVTFLKIIYPNYKFNLNLPGEDYNF